ncbi:uroporphyrinogen-III C-methyltransferase [Ancylothrix sp. C2]|uniref:uroporphyrinogen-III C-methyltransferase n=1 Tax=Ancylothrix sp. D3o TaxID=2953691 RepID=UPI0021BA4F3B|nr:uroporphyrinogen-III C-methyltransferase [Ancylothrix sp. D3o]MCT7948596.1 uroporphyrinogen-III C-methyltransferase [Ancylothrix sp. D3o]
MTIAKGKVYLVGAGPGNLSYLTVEAYNLLASAEVLVYDALINQEMLKIVPINATLIEVGKRGGKPSTPQEEIDRLLVEQCQKGKQVIRLKSGDPFIFGRVASEIQALQKADCNFEIIPGISSALAAPLLAGIPLTDPVLSRCFAVLSAHEPDALDWQSLANIETLVILMGGRQLDEIIHQLHRHGKPISTPVAVIRSSSHPDQKIWTGNLGNISFKTNGESLSPAIIVIGEVVRLREFFINNSPKQILNLKPPILNTMDAPLSNKTVLVTRSAGQSGSFTKRLEAAGANVIEMPALQIGPPSSWEELDNSIANLSQFDWLILTSTNGVDYFFERLLAQNKDARALANLKIAVVGEKTAQSLQQRQIQPDFIPPNFVADSLVENFPEKVAGKTILFPRVESGGREVLVKELTAKNAKVIEVAAYESRCPEKIVPQAWEALQNHRVDIITFASSKTVKNFCHLIQKADIGGSGIASLLENVCLASIGPQTSKTCLELFGRVDLEAQEYTMEGLFQSLIHHYG